MAAGERPALRMTGVRKAFGPLVALDGVDFAVAAGEIHALLGENGAGKTTLMRILYGLLKPDSGSVELDGKTVHFGGPRDARAAGIGMVHQHLMLVESLTVAENLALDAGVAHGLLFRRAVEETRTTELAQKLGLELDGSRLVRDLSLGQRQRVEIAKALMSGARVLVLDEPTAVLTPLEVRDLFATLRELAARGRAVVFIAHKLSEVLELCDRVTVLRHGSLQGTVAVGDTSATDLAKRMVGHALEGPRPACAARKGQVVLAVEALRVEDPHREAPAEGVTLEVLSGEIVGVAGVEGNGQLELCESIAGTRPALSGRVLLCGADVTGRSPLELARLGLGVVPEDRTRNGIVMEMTLAENLALKAHRRPELSAGPFVRPAAWEARARRLVDENDVRPGDVRLPAAALSGGNQQKLLLAREMDERPAFLLAASPTRGLDVGATESVHRKLLEARDSGMAILLFSTDLDEVLALSTRILVAFRGRFSEVSPDRADRDSIGLLMGGETAAHATA